MMDSVAVDLVRLDYLGEMRLKIWQMDSTCEGEDGMGWRHEYLPRSAAFGHHGGLG